MRRLKHAKTALATPSVAYTDWNDWLVDETGAVIDLAPATSVLAAPDYVGQFAVIGTGAYIATGTSGAGDWKLIT